MNEQWWEKKDTLKIILDNQDEDSKHVRLPLYENNYMAGIESIITLAKKTYELNKTEPERRVQGDLGNILAFIGQRGSGKTTAVRGFCDVLKTISDHEEKEWWLKHSVVEADFELFRRKDFAFHVLEPIDASLLEEKENIFELIIVKLYQWFSEQVDTHSGSRTCSRQNINEIAKLFENIIVQYRILQGKDKWKDYSIATMLHHMGGSSSIMKNVQELVKQLLCFSKRKCDYEYFVIVIDDLDLNLKHGYEILEQLQKYFCHYNMLILVAVDYSQMHYVCVEHMHKEMQFVDKKNENGIFLSSELTNNYLTKVLPVAHRIFMPDIKRLGKRIQISVENGIEINVKKFVMAKIATKMKIYYDGVSAHRHFSEPNNIRTLVSYNDFLNSMIPIHYEELDPKREDKKNNVILKAYDQNHHRFNQDILYRQVQNVLDFNELNTFKEIMKCELENRAEFFVNSEDYFDAHPHKYTYGDLLQALFKCNEDMRNCIIASFTSEMVREYMHYKYQLDSDRRKNSINRLEKYIGITFSNSWFSEIFPGYIVFENKKEENENGRKDYTKVIRTSVKSLGYSQVIDGSSTVIYFSIKKLEKSFEMDTSSAWHDGFKAWLEQTEIISVLECIDLLTVKLDGSRGESSDVLLNIERPLISKRLLFGNRREDLFKPSDKVLSVQIQSMGETAVSTKLDVMSFVKKSLYGSKYIQKLHEKIVDNILKVIKDYINAHVDVSGHIDIEKRIEWLEKEGPDIIKENMGIQEADIDHVAFPFYNLDISHNILRRVRNEQRIRYVEKGRIYESLVAVYDSIGNKLKDEVDFYEKTTHVKLDYYSDFTNSPFVKFLISIKNNRKVVAVINEWINMVFTGANLTSMEPSDND